MDEEWRTIEGYPHYEVSNLGRVRSLDRIIIKSNGSRHTVRGRTLKPGVDASGYLSVGLGTLPMGRVISRRIHKLVSIAFLGPCDDGMEVRHINGCKTDNRKENLCYGTRSENAMDRHDHGTMRTKISIDDARCIKFRANSGEKKTILAKEYGVSKVTINLIARGSAWPHA